MLNVILIVASLVTTPAPEGQPEAECIKLYPDEWGKIVECAYPSIDLEKNPKLRDFFAACNAAREATQARGAKLESAVITVHGVTQICETP